MPEVSTPLIILLHGFAAHWLLMKPLERAFRQDGYQTKNWGYSSWFKSIDHHGQQLADLLRTMDENEKITEIHFVTHSMGCIVTRAAIQKFRPRKIGRWVMLAPPNRGTPVANRLAGATSWLFKPIGELQASPDSFVNQIPIPAEIDIAVVQATRDFIVTEPYTQIDEEKDRYVVPGLHSAMLFRKDVAQQSLHFIQHGSFDPDISEQGLAKT